MDYDKVSLIKKMIRILSINEQDPPVRCFFRLLTKLYYYPTFERMLAGIVRGRPRVSEEHLAFLLFVSLQHLTDFSYDELTEENVQQYEKKLKFDLDSHSDEIEKLCVERNVSTNVVERYAGLQIILSLLKKGDLIIADIGTSVGLGIMSLNTATFGQVEIQDPLLQECLAKKINIARAIGIDIQTPDMKWQLACYLPESKRMRAEFEHMWDYLRTQGQKFDFVRADAARLHDAPELSPRSVDIAWISNTCYQIEDEIVKVEQGIQWLLKSDGMWLYAYYRHPDWRFATKANPYVVTLRRNDDWSHKLELLKSPSDCMEKITRAKDFKKFQNYFCR